MDDLNVEQITRNLLKALHEIQWHTWGAAALYVVGGFMIASFVSTVAGRILSKHTSKHYTQIIKRILYYGILIISLVFALAALQLDMKVLGIATVLTLALGFASQAAMSNIVSGLFLVFEKPFVVGDHVEFNGQDGELLSIDLLSIKIRTFDNTLVRIPNETLLKNQFKNLTKFPIRRLDTVIHISYNEDLDKIREALFALALKNPVVLESPPAQLLFEEFSDNAITFKFAVWVKKETFQSFKNSFPCDIYQAFKHSGIKFPAISIQLEKST